MGHLFMPPGLFGGIVSQVFWPFNWVVGITHLEN
jgi:hypothetical protein